jgi:hypothetical protein
LVHLHISYLSCAKAKTNMFPRVFWVLSLRLKGKWSLRRRQSFHSTDIIYPSPSLRIALHIGIIRHSYIICQRGRESKKGSKDSIFGDLCQRGRESISPKQKDRTSMPISKNFETKFKVLLFSIDIFQISIPLRNSVSFGIEIFKGGVSQK